jgi:hypothetical protein
MKRTVLANRRVIFKLHGMEPLNATVLKQDETGYWVRSANVAERLEQPNCSMPDSDVRYLEFSKIEWLRTIRRNS